MLEVDPKIIHAVREAAQEAARRIFTKSLLAIPSPIVMEEIIVVEVLRALEAQSKGTLDKIDKER